MTKTGKLKIQWGHLVLLAIIAGWILAYLLDARATSMRVSNLLLVQPVAILALILVLVLVPQCFVREQPNDNTLAANNQDTPPAKETPLELAKIGILTAAFVALAFLMERIGFDVSVFAFLVLGLYICGERNWIANLAFSAIFTVALIYGYGAIIPFPFPLAVL
ncbi:tripartite tricarboxylate transporter TctB family protein [Roseibaca sp. V10]|uniref:Tripartite tricarboxylate transporter TctB family protein n=1 Tax=Roseinatronobacter domitianus TaxID=2940293 RepID=A0ABT0M541_9RHOB|nr:tripartite tricarboxylate transporter TctB family protein [Roseibaca domitiana]MCL1629984.1 tripartite tricarboxylate transporter TctB family protein [Roseibaca domitiana]